MKKVFFILLFLFINICISQELSEIIIPSSTNLIDKSIDNGINKFSRKSDRYKLNGKFKIYETQLNTKTDIVNSYYNTGFVFKGTFNKGYKNGLWKTLYKNKLVKTINYRNGLVIGRYRVYNTKGAILYKTTFGAKGNGKFEDYYYKTGALKQEGNYKNGKKEGEWCDYNELGETTKITVYNKGMPQE